jgi:NADH-quinone oxidoreductase subunit B
MKDSTGDVHRYLSLSSPFSLSDRNHDMDELYPQGEKFPKLIDPSASFGAFIGKLGDVSVKEVDKPLGQAVNWGRICISYGQFTLRLCAVVESLVQHRVLVITYNALAFLKPLALRECDLIIVLGTVNRKMAPRLRVVYDQMPELKYV